jgi:hypothetical protein
VFCVPRLTDTRPTVPVSVDKSRSAVPASATKTCLHTMAGERVPCVLVHEQPATDPLLVAGVISRSSSAGTTAAAAPAAAWRRRVGESAAYP